MRHFLQLSILALSLTASFAASAKAVTVAILQSGSLLHKRVYFADESSLLEGLTAQKVVMFTRSGLLANDCVLLETTPILAKVVLVEVDAAWKADYILLKTNNALLVSKGCDKLFK